jgi:hypothetical protein
MRLADLADDETFAIRLQPEIVGVVLAGHWNVLPRYGDRAGRGRQ